MAIPATFPLTVDESALRCRHDELTLQGLGGLGLRIYARCLTQTKTGKAELGQQHATIVSDDVDGNGQNDLVQVFAEAAAAYEAEFPGKDAPTPTQFLSLCRALAQAAIEFNVSAQQSTNPSP